MDHLEADCGSCFGLCCVALPFSASADFKFDKPAAQPCRNLQADFRCGVHARLREEGFAGCTVFDCFGAGQKVSRDTFGGQDWRRRPDLAVPMFDVFGVMRQLHELLWYLTEALATPPAAAVHGDVRRALRAVEDLTEGTPETLAALDVSVLRHDVRPLLREASRLARADAPGPCTDLRGADLVGATLSGADLRGADLANACLIGADLSDADLRRADLIGADLRAADLRGADLTGCLFLTRPQVSAARGDVRTQLPETLPPPGHWRAGRT